MKQRAGFATRVGAIAATVGSAVGLGNIWRFPYEAGENGGGVFILIYILCVLVLGIPVMLAEFVLGRSTHKNLQGALQELSPQRPFHLFAYVCIIGAVVTLSFYSVVCGWVAEYLFQAVCGGLQGHTPQQYGEMFGSLTGSAWRCSGWTLLFLAVNFAVMLRGVQRGVERASNVMMPLLFVLLVVFSINSLLLPDAGKGLAFLFSPDWSKLSGRVVVDAMGQAFMSLTLGISGLVTYASYFNDRTSLTRDAVTVASLDTLVAILAGVMIFPAVFSFGLTPEAGPKLIFEILPNVFGQLPGGYVWGILFFILLIFASLTSTISLSEVSVTFLVEQRSMSRRRATSVTAAIVVPLALLCALSFNVLADIKAWGMTIFDLFNYAASNVFMLMGGLFTAVYVGWFLERKVVWTQLTNNGRLRGYEVDAVRFCLRWVAPISLVLIFLWYVGLL